MSENGHNQSPVIESSQPENESPSKPLQKIEADGNCLFRALSFCLFNTQDEYRSVREDIFKHIASNWEEYQCFIIGDESYNTPITSIEDYKDQISTESILGGDVELCAAASVFNIFIRVHRSLDDNTSTEFGSKKHKPISLLYTADGDAGHYDVILE